MILSAAVDINTVYPIASASKSFLSAAVMVLVEQGKIDLDTPIIHYMPDFAMWNDDSTKNVTVRDALCHRSGLPRHDISLFTNQETSLADMVQKVRFLQPEWPLRQRFCYQNHMYGVASLLVEKVSGMAWGDFIKKNIFDPVGMNSGDTQYAQFVREDDNYARPMLNVLGLSIKTKTMNPDSTGGAGAISANIRDFLQWGILNLNEGAHDAGNIFSPASAKELHGEQMPIHPGELTPYSIKEVQRAAYGLGWFVEQYRGTKIVHHGGTITGYKSLVGFVPEKDFAFAVLTNQNNSQAPAALGYSFVDLLLGAGNADWNNRFMCFFKESTQKAKTLYDETRVRGKTVPDISGCEGRYSNPAYGTLTVVEKRGQLFAQMLGSKMKMVPSVKDDFAIDTGLLRLAIPCKFVRENDGDATALLAKIESSLSEYIVFQKEKSADDGKAD